MGIVFEKIGYMGSFFEKTGYIGIVLREWAIWALFGEMGYKGVF